MPSFKQVIIIGISMAALILAKGCGYTGTLYLPETRDVSKPQGNEDSLPSSRVEDKK